MSTSPLPNLGDTIFRSIALLLAAAMPLIIPLWQGVDLTLWPSLSSYWRTPAQALFILSNAATAFYFFTQPSWRVPAILLTALTAFSLDFFPNAHNLLAVAFFVSCIAPLWQNAHSVRFKLVYPFVLSALLLAHSLLLAEIVAIEILVIHQMIKLGRVWQVLIKRNLP